MALLDMYDEEFNGYLNLAKTLITQLRRKDDREICMKWIKKLIGLRTRDASVKKNRNAFFKYMLQVLQQGVLDGQSEYPGYDDMHRKANLEQNTKRPFMSRWSPDRRTYVAAQPIPGHGALVYMAVAKDPSLGWDIPQNPK